MLCAYMGTIKGEKPNEPESDPSPIYKKKKLARVLPEWTRRIGLAESLSCPQCENMHLKIIQLLLERVKILKMLENQKINSEEQQAL